MICFDGNAFGCDRRWAAVFLVMVQQCRPAVEPLPGERVIRRQHGAGRRDRPHVAPRIVPLPHGLPAIAAVAHAGRAEMIAEAGGVYTGLIRYPSCDPALFVSVVPPVARFFVAWIPLSYHVNLFAVLPFPAPSGKTHTCDAPCLDPKSHHNNRDHE